MKDKTCKVNLVESLDSEIEELERQWDAADSTGNRSLQLDIERQIKLLRTRQALLNKPMELTPNPEVPVKSKMPSKDVPLNPKSDKAKDLWNKLHNVIDEANLDDLGRKSRRVDQKSIDTRYNRLQKWLDDKKAKAPGNTNDEKTTWLWRNDPTWKRVVNVIMKLNTVEKTHPDVHKANRQADRYYIRFGDFPKSKKSMNHLVKREEAGVSVYPAKWSMKHNMWEIITDELSDVGIGTLDSLICDFGNGKGRPIYLVYGQETNDMGMHDIEPLLNPDHVKILKRLKPEEVWIEYYDEPISQIMAESVEPNKGHTMEEFCKIGYEQRNLPEDIMLEIQRIMVGGVLNPVVEHAGDIIHRMNDINTFDRAGYEYVAEKVKRVLWYLTNPYGFEKEFRENLAANRTNYNLLSHKLKAYGKAHRDLPTFNKAQKLVQSVCISIGNQDWSGAATYLRQLNPYLKDEKTWKSFAHEGLIE